MTFSTKFLGCKVNSYEVEAIANEMIKNDYQEVKLNEHPDVVIINTCAVTETAETKSKKYIKKIRKENPESIICVMGCYAQNNSKTIAEDLGADIVIGTSHRDELAKYIEQYKKTHTQIIKIDKNNSIKKYENIKVSAYYKNTRAYVKIQDGCNNFCTYCLIPYIRGRSRSRSSEEIINEINNLIENGYKEIILVGIDMCSYGQDLKNENINFSDLIEKILVNCPNLYRLRISSIEESQIDDKFIELLRDNQKIANHLHIPLQSGSVSVLKSMNRKYNLASFEEKIAKLREVRPDISITTDIVVGFPTETDEYFEETYNFCEKIRFSKIHVFPFSPRKGTIAYKMEPVLSDFDKKVRVSKLIALSERLEEEYKSQFYDKDIEFLLECYSKKDKGYKCHSSNYLETIYTTSKKNLEGELVTFKYKEKFNFFDTVKLELFR